MSGTGLQVCAETSLQVSERKRIPDLRCKTGRDLAFPTLAAVSGSSSDLPT